MKNFVTIFTGVVVAGVVITFSAFSMRAEADQRQRIYDEAVAERDQRESDRLKAEEPYRLEAEKERSLVEKAKADTEKAKAKADEAFANAIREHPVTKAFMGPEASEEEVSEEEISEDESSEEEASEEEISEEEASEEEISEEETSDEEPLYDEVASTAALSLTAEEEDFVLRVFYAETGDYNSDKFLKANAWLLRNGIEKYGFWEALTPKHYQVIGYDGIVRGAEGIVTSEMAHENDRITSIFYGVMSGEIESPIADYTCGLPYDVWYESGDEFAAQYGIEEYVIFDNGIYYPDNTGNLEALTELLNNTPA